MTSSSRNVARAFALTAALFSVPPIAGAETKCEVKTQVCTDVRAGSRICQVTICKDEKGDIVSTDVIVLKTADGETTTAPAGPKVRVPRTQIQGLTKQ